MVRKILQSCGNFLVNKRITIPMDKRYLFGTPKLIPATMVAEYLPILEGRWLTNEQEFSSTKEISWTQLERDQYCAVLPYCIFEWATCPDGNYFQYNFSCQEQFNLPLSLDIMTKIFFFKDGRIMPQTTIFLKGSVDDLLLYKLTF